MVDHCKSCSVLRTSILTRKNNTKVLAVWSQWPLGQRSEHCSSASPSVRNLWPCLSLLYWAILAALPAVPHGSGKARLNTSSASFLSRLVGCMRWLWALGRVLATIFFGPAPHWSSGSSAIAILLARELVRRVFGLVFSRAMLGLLWFSLVFSCRLISMLAIRLAIYALRRWSPWATGRPVNTQLRQPRWRYRLV